MNNSGIPYFTMAVICYMVFIILPNIMDYALNRTYNFESTIRYLIGIVYSRGTSEWLPNSSPLWFLTCLFVTEVMFFLFMNYCKKNRLFFIVIIAGSGYISSLFLPKLPWNIDTALTAIVFMYIGYTCKKINVLEKINGYKNTSVIIPMIISIVLLWLSNKFNDIEFVDFDGNKYGNIIFMYLGAIAGSYLIILFSLKLSQSKILKFFGLNTLPIIGFNYVGLTVVHYVFIILNLNYNWVISLAIQLIIFTLMIIVLKRIPILSDLVYGNLEQNYYKQRIKKFTA